jgi:NADPH:quinone reductase-like Zn-dependent oxidoreductase
MKAVKFTKYGSFESIRMVEEEIPSPKAKQVLIKVKNSSLNAMEWHLFRGVFMAKLKTGMRTPKVKYQTLGADIAGEVIEVGSEVRKFKKGDQVFGEDFSGGFAEYAIAEQDSMTIKPEMVTSEQAAASPVAGLTALTSLRQICKVQKGDKVLINGGSGGVGSYAVMMAKYYGAEVTAVCSEKNFEFVKGLGADHLIDYNKTDFCTEGKKYKWILEVTGNRKPKELKAILEEGGKCAVIGFNSAKHLIRYMFSFSKKIKMVNEIASPEVLSELATILASGKVVMPITDRFNLSEITEGLKKMSTRRTCGKMLVIID